MDTCYPYITNKDMGKTKSVDGTDLIANDVAVPCGLIAKTYFNGIIK